MDACGLLKIPKLILGCDLNLTLHARETWGSTRLDVDVDYFTKLFETSSLVDNQLIKLSPTWHNGRK